MGHKFRGLLYPSNTAAWCEFYASTWHYTHIACCGHQVRASALHQASEGSTGVAMLLPTTQPKKNTREKERFWQGRLVAVLSDEREAPSQTNTRGSSGIGETLAWGSVHVHFLGTVHIPSLLGQQEDDDDAKRPR